MGTRTRTVRLPAEQAEAIDAIAVVDRVSTDEEIRQAIEAHIETRRHDAEFQKRLHASIQRNREILELLSR